MSAYTLYHVANTCSLASFIALEEAGADYDVHRLDFSKQEQTQPAFLAINPKGRVPALVTPQGVLTETIAILGFVAQTFPDARLAPLDDPFAFGQLQAFNSYMASTVHVAHAHGPRGSRWADDPAAQAAMKEKVPATMTACCEVIEKNMLVGPWVMGDAYSIADPYLFTIGLWLERDGVDTAAFPKILAHRARMQARPAVMSVMARA